MISALRVVSGDPAVAQQEASVESPSENRYPPGRYRAAVSLGGGEGVVAEDHMEQLANGSEVSGIDDAHGALLSV